eukprot:386092-Prorocentrum_minimum.AAC.1
MQPLASTLWGANHLDVATNRRAHQCGGARVRVTRIHGRALQAMRNVSEGGQRGVALRRGALEG